MGAQRQSAAQRATFNDIISIGELIKSVKEGNVGIKKIAERSGYAFRGRGRYHDPELNDFYYEDVYYKNCMVAADGSPIKYGKGNSSVLISRKRWLRTFRLNPCLQQTCLQLHKIGTKEQVPFQNRRGRWQVDNAEERECDC